MLPLVTKCFILAVVFVNVASRDRGRKHRFHVVEAKRQTSEGRYTSAEEAEALAKHNEYRTSILNPPAKANSIKTMMWDTELATAAQEWADRCVWEHGNVQWVKDKRGSIGQNLYKSSGMGGGSTATVSWFNEYVDYEYCPRTCNQDSAPPGEKNQCGHYTQVVWANSDKLGCARSYCTPVRDSDGAVMGDRYMVVCNYSPAGNYAGQRPYETENPTFCPPEQTTTKNNGGDSNGGVTEESTNTECHDQSFCNAFWGCHYTFNVQGYWDGKKVSEACPQQCGNCTACADASYCKASWPCTATFSDGETVAKKCPVQCNACPDRK